MEKLRIRGGRPLHGHVPISGAKNASLPMLAAALLTSEPVHLSNVPRLRDVHTMIAVLQSLGANASFSAKDRVTVQANNIDNLKAPYDLVKTMRASFLVLGPLLARFQFVEVSLPGGCAIGTRPIDQHLKALSALGATIELKEGYVTAQIDGRLRGSLIHMDIATVTGTQNALMAATLADGDSTIVNVAREPEIVALASMLNDMGADIHGAGTDVIHVKGKESLHGCTASLMPDRIEAGTFLLAGAATRGCITINGGCHALLDAPIAKLRQSGAEVSVDGDYIQLDTHGKQPRAVDIRTATYPGIPTDLQAQFLALNCVAKGTSRVTETIFENRFMHVPELARLGASIESDGTTATIEGVSQLHGANIMATDLRASSCLVIGGLAAIGETIVDRVYHLDRGYEHIEAKLTSVGADIQRFSD
ncbi:MAG: UDP-N-acetylglucosamine 1-carboxyvinyltransferase [Gammaproteobacteria bacterium]|nr:UDP-N-acetylglucosamine 1-carboxyvinyltransferase [Gammaproteobacteria bacterium]